jgi:hypothetical protein
MGHNPTCAGCGEEIEGVVYVIDADPFCRDCVLLETEVVGEIFPQKYLDEEE